jgi:hypothetical protein
VETQRTFAQAAGFPALAPVVDDYLPVKVTGPVIGNITVGAKKVTAFEAQYAPDGYDGHFVSTSHPRARALVLQFLGTFMRDALPTGGP